MKLQWPVSFKSSHETKSRALGLTDDLGKFLIFGTDGLGNTPSSAISLYEKSTSVSIPINMIAESFASINPVIKQDDKIITSHPILDLLANPSPYFTGDLFLESIAKDYLITGESEIIALGGINRPPLEIQSISPKHVNVIEGSGGLAISFNIDGNTLTGSYKLIKARNRVRYLDGGLRELKQIRNYSTKNNSLLRGQSLLLAASAEARQHILGNTHNVSLLEKGGRVSLVFHFDSDFSPDDFNAARDNVRDQYGGAQNAGEIGVTAGGNLDIKELGTNNKDMDFAKLQAAAKSAVALQYKVPLPLITNDAATFSNMKESTLMLYDNAVLPLADRLFGGLTSLLAPRYGLDPAKVRITYDIDSITALASRRAEELKLRKELNIETINEMRTAIGRESIGTGGDSVLVPANMIPAGSDMFTSDNLSTPSPDRTLARDIDGE